MKTSPNFLVEFPSRSLGWWMGDKKKESSSGLSFNKFIQFLSGVLVAGAALYTILAYYKPDPPLLAQINEHVQAIYNSLVPSHRDPTPVPTPSLGIITDTPAPAQGDWVSMSILSTEDDGIRINRARYAKLKPGSSTEFVLLLQVESTKGPRKVFVSNNGLEGWSVSSINSGYSCVFYAGETTGLVSASASDYASHVSEIPTLSPGQMLDATVTVSCNHELTAADRFSIRARLYALADLGSAQPSTSSRAVPIIYVSNDISAQ